MKTISTSLGGVSPSDDTVPARSKIDTAPLEDGDRVGRYTIRRRLGEGGMGVVYAAHDPDLAREVALKVLRSERGGNVALESRLQREARSLARVAHDNLV